MPKDFREDKPFQLKSTYSPAGDQPRAIRELVEGIGSGRQVLLGVTGSGKTFTMANVIAKVNRPALILAHNKTLAAQLYSEFKELFPENAVRYFVSYFDYYQPEAYMPSTDTYIEKDSSVNDEIDKLRHAATKALIERRDTIVVASVSCIYGLGDPKNYFDMMLYFEKAEVCERDVFLKRLVELQYKRNDVEFVTGTFRVRGDVVDICPASESENALRVEFFGDEIEEIVEIDRLSGKNLRKLTRACIYPASHFVTERSSVERALKTIKEELDHHLLVLKNQGKLFEAHRLEQRTLYDLEQIEQIGFCSGIENYSRHLTGRDEGEPPPTLVDYFPDDFLVFIDESHVTVPQLNGMFRGDRARKQNLVEYGFRLPSALDNRPLNFDEFNELAREVIYVSATPGKYEVEVSKGRVIEQIIRPTALVDPMLSVRPASSQVDDFLEEVRKVADLGDRVLVTTLTKRMAEDLSEYYREVGVRVRYLHSDISTLDRIELIQALRDGEYDLLIGINLLREGLDLPEVSLVGVFDADKEGFLRSRTSLIQTIGRAARHINGRVILYADNMTDSLKAAIEETDRRRELQEDHNRTRGIVPTAVKRSPEAVMIEVEQLGELLKDEGLATSEIPKSLKECEKLLAELKKEMFSKANAMEFEKAASLRDKVSALEKYMLNL